MATATTSFAGVRNSSLFTHPNPIVRLGLNSFESLKLGHKFDKIVCLHKNYNKKSSRCNSFLVKCQASAAARITQQEFTELAWQAIVSSPDIARENKQQVVETEHLMKVLLEQKNGLACRIFSSTGVDNTRLLEATEIYIQRQPKIVGEFAGYTLGRDLEGLIQRARDCMKEFGDSFVSVEHLVLAFAQDKRFGKQLFGDFRISEQKLQSAVQAVRGRQCVIDQDPEGKYAALETHGKDLTAMAREGKLDPVTGRDDEIRRCIQILSRRTKSNPVLIGEPGVGKTAIAEGFAQRIVKGDVPGEFSHFPSCMEVPAEVENKPLLSSGNLGRGLENKVLYSKERDEHVLTLSHFPSKGVEKDEKVMQPLSSNENLGRDLECGGEGLRENKVFYLEERDEEVLSTRILNLARTNRRTSALVLFRSMEISGLRPNLHAVNSLLACFLRSNMIDEMMGVFAFMKKSNIISGHSCSLVLKAVAKHCGSETALQMFLEWDGESDMHHHYDPVVYNTMISIFGKENNWVQMKKIWKNMKKNGIIGTEITYRVLVCTFVRCGQYEIAIDAYFELLQNDLEPGSDAMQAIIGACAKEEKSEMALSVFYNMLKCGLNPNLVACNALINLLGKAGKVKEAYNVYKHIRSLGHEPDSYTWNALLTAFYRANQYISALQLFDSIQKDLNFKPSSYIYNTVLMCCQRLGYWEKALQFLWKMEKSGVSVSTESYNLVISVCESAKKPEVALQIYEHMTHKKCHPDTFTHLSLIRSCIWGDLWDEVDTILDESPPNVSLYNAAIHGMCLRRKVESAKNLYLKMRDIGLVPDGKTRALMLQYMLKRTW